MFLGSPHAPNASDGKLVALGNKATVEQLQEGIGHTQQVLIRQYTIADVT